MDIPRLKLKRNIVILGAGYGGIACALRIEKKLRRHPDLSQDFNIILVDKRNYHLYTPALYDVATIAADDASPLNIKKAIATPIEEIIEGKHIVFLQGKVLKVNIPNRIIAFEDKTEITWEYLVFALGSESAHFGISGVREYAISLKGLDDAIHIRATVRRMYDARENDGTLSVVVGGGGPTGVEFAAELIGYIGELDRKLKKNIHPVVTVVEGALTILPGFDLWTVTRAQKRLKQLGVHLKENFLVAKADEEKIFVKPAPDGPEERIPYDIFVWSGGVQAINVLANGGLSVEKRGRMETDPFMICISPDKHLDIAKNIFAIGDNACFVDPETHRPPPATARLAIEQGKVAGENIWRDLNGKPRKEFRVWKYPYVIPIGGKYAIAEVGPFKLQGILAWFFHELVELYYLSSITHDKWTAFKRWVRGLEIFSKND